MRVRGFGELEAVVMDRVWNHDPEMVTVRDIFEELSGERRIAYTTVMSTMDNLYNKGWLERERDGRAYRYWATLTREEHTARLMRDALDGEAVRTGAQLLYRADRPQGIRATQGSVAAAGEAVEQGQEAVNVAACLLLYSVAVIVFGPPALGFLTRAGHAPRSGVAAWLIAIGSVLLTWLTVVVLVIVDVVAHWHDGGSFVVSCVRLLCDLAAGKAGSAPQVMLLASAVAVVGTVAVIGIRLVRVVGRLRAHAYEHAEAVRLVGRPTGERDVYVVDAAERTAYCVAGKPPAIVVTTAAVAARRARTRSGART